MSDNPPNAPGTEHPSRERTKGAVLPYLPFVACLALLVFSLFYFRDSLAYKSEEPEIVYDRELIQTLTHNGLTIVPFERAYQTYEEFTWESPGGIMHPPGIFEGRCMCDFIARYGCSIGSNYNDISVTAEVINSDTVFTLHLMLEAPTVVSYELLPETFEFQELSIEHMSPGELNEQMDRNFQTMFDELISDGMEMAQNATSVDEIKSKVERQLHTTFSVLGIDQVDVEFI